MREITTHRVDGDTNPGVTISVVGDPGVGGANHRYEVRGADFSKNASASDPPNVLHHDLDPERLVVLFQNGDIPAAGVNGVTHEALLAIVADRLQAFQDGPFPSQENADALRHVNEALRALHKRTLNRIKRGVEGQAVA